MMIAVVVEEEEEAKLPRARRRYRNESRTRMGPRPTERELGVNFRASTRRFAGQRFCIPLRLRPRASVRRCATRPGGNANVLEDDESGPKEEPSFLVGRQTKADPRIDLIGDGVGSAVEKRRPSGRFSVGSGRPLKIRASTEQSRASTYRTTASGLRGEKPLADIEQCRQGKSPKQIRTFGTRIGP